VVAVLVTLKPDSTLNVETFKTIRDHCTVSTRATATLKPFYFFLFWLGKPVWGCINFLKLPKVNVSGLNFYLFTEAVIALHTAVFSTGLYLKKKSR